MRNWTLVVGAALATSLLGCQAPRTHHRAAHHRDRVASHATAAKVVELVSLEHGEDYTTDSVLVLPAVKGPKSTWRILVGPNPGGGRLTVNYSNTEPDVWVENGWAYIVVQPVGVPTTAPAGEEGSGWGRARTKRITATAEGTRFIVQQEGDLHRVILLSGSPEKPDKVDVQLHDPGSDDQPLTGVRKYFEVDSSIDHLPGAADVPDTSRALGQFVAYVESVADVAGVK
jgi:hypothetical protein